MKNLLISALFLFTACSGAITELYPEEKSERNVPVFIVNHGWHVAIAIESSYIKPHLPQPDQYPDAKYLMFGWGDRCYYTNRNAGTWLMLRAAIFPTESVLHVAGVNRPLDQYFRSSTIVRIMISTQGADQMSKYIANQFRITDGALTVAADGLYPNSIFFEAKGSYYFPKTSNNWTARVLRKSGFPISTFYSITSGNVVKQAARHGEVIQKH